MKILKKLAVFLCAAAILMSVCGCSSVDKNYGVKKTESTSSDSAKQQEIAYSIPSIKSSDTVMPKFIDISLYDEENYSQIYLGKKFKFKVSYAGNELTVPTTYKKLTKLGWQPADTSEYNEDSTILAGETVDSIFINDNGKKLGVRFYNSSNSSVKLKKCTVVSLGIDGNSLYDTSGEYDTFNVNGITNNSAITDIIEAIGSPSHFYALSPTEYYLDYFISEADRRNGITVYINPADDCVTKILISYYK